LVKDKLDGQKDEDLLLAGEQDDIKDGKKDQVIDPDLKEAVRFFVVDAEADRAFRYAPDGAPIDAFGLGVAANARGATTRVHQSCSFRGNCAGFGWSDLFHCFQGKSDPVVNHGGCHGSGARGGLENGEQRTELSKS